ncbi:CAP domain-containing protein (plasmid) [Sulfitobacter sp. W027]|uniref:CAP domain-containing protein n=1 Tax=Sulfitobacter sp. W027 TaxID=2867025 RepID=UPI0021A67EE9|nr:CAP domain-containing protein [Sulfitobacter sp. W027]UWR35834.1 CAP domain-containing protein [Sulfitobacter sp. W027]
MVYATDLELYMLELVNQERSALNLDLFELETNLNQSADDHSEWMLENNVFSHTGVDDTSPTQRIRAADFDLSGSWRTAENLAIQSERGEEGYRDDVANLHRLLMESPGHRANILSPDLDYIGIGIDIGSFTYSSGATALSVVATQNFGSTEGHVDLDDLNGDRGTPEADTVPSGPEDSGDVVAGAVLTGGADDEVLNGGAGDDTLHGGDGNDTLNGGEGNDYLHGGSDADRIWASAGNDRVLGGAGDDVIGGMDGTDTIWAGSGNDTIYAGNGSDVVGGGNGNDAIWGNRGDDRIWGNDGHDTIDGGQGHDTLDGGNDADRIWAGTGNDLLLGGAGDDVLGGMDGFDKIWAGSGDDTIYAGGWSDTVGGGDGNDVIWGANGNDLIWGGDGHDKIDGGLHNDSLYGGGGDDRISGDAGNDSLMGSWGRDTLRGGAGDDTLEGGAGNDLLTGGTGDDTFVFAVRSGRDEISDFDDGDVLRLDEDLWSATHGQLNTQQVVSTFGRVTDGNTTLEFDGGEVLVLNGVNDLIEIELF